jgi:nitroreductase
MELKKILDKRRSTRKFSDRKVEKQKLQSIVEMTLQAPSSRNSRSTRLWVVEQPELLQHIADMRDYGSAFVKNAAAAILVMGDRTATDLWVDNCAISATFVQLAVTAMDLVSCWVHVNGRPRLKAEPEGAKAEDYVRDLLGVRDGLRPYCIIAIGYPQEEA